MAIAQQQMQQAVEQRQIGAGRNLEEEGRLVGRGGPPRVDDDELCTRFDPVHHAQKRDRVAVGHVGADDQEQVGAIEILV